jgi:hypothetical protein
VERECGENVRLRLSERARLSERQRDCGQSERWRDCGENVREIVRREIVSERL